MIGDFQPGNLYENVKTHKQGNKLRPIISKITSSTCKTAKSDHITIYIMKISAKVN